MTTYFGEVDFGKLDEWYETAFEVNGKQVEVSMTISKAFKTIDESDIRRVDDYVAALQNHEKDIRTLLQHDFAQKGATREYIDLQIGNQDKDDIAELIENVGKRITKREKLLSIMSLLRVVFYPEKEDDMFAVFDYTIDEDLTDDVLAVKLRKDSSVSLAIES
ncbi:DUF2004 domain-containing protein [Hymenobacter edaphi]|uniref:DUF2004 domain-containing protein n=1 Tax=Hymenobacter edaphi TaxID=2211146 RepID=UPI001A9F6FFD|nr:DUF2004 domain-containing protein [Hymenobacter edaphi]